MRQFAAGATVLNVVDDKLGTPTYTVDFARNLEALIDTEFYGLYNMVCGGETGRFEVAQELVDILGLENLWRSGPWARTSSPRITSRRDRRANVS